VCSCQYSGEFPQPWLQDSEGATGAPRGAAAEGVAQPTGLACRRKQGPGMTGEGQLGAVSPGPRGNEGGSVASSCPPSD